MYKKNPVRKKYFFNILILIVTTVLLLAIFEISIRVFFRDKTYVISENTNNILRIFEEDDAITWTLKPNSSQRHMALNGDFDVDVTINSKGFRDYENLSYDRFKILIFGDSFTFGFGVELDETYSKWLEKELEPYNITVINGGYVGGMALDTQYIYLKNNFNKLKPNIVIMSFHPNTDYADVQGDQWVYDEDGNIKKIITYYKVDKDSNSWYTPETIPPIFKLNPIWELNKFLRAHSYAYQFTKDRLTNINAGKIYTYNISEQTIKKVDIVVGKLKELSDAKKFSLVFVIIPERDDLLKNNYKNDKILDILKKHNIITIDLLPKLAHIEPYTMDFKNDRHYNAEMHKEVGEILAQELLNYNLIPLP